MSEYVAYPNKPYILSMGGRDHDIRGTMTDKMFDQWVAALRGGNYKQTKHGFLCEHVSNNRNQQGLTNDNANGDYYCCLGVLLDLNGRIAEDNDRDGEVLSESGAWDLGLQLEAVSGQNHDTLQYFLSVQNDEDWDFEDIANFLEEHRDYITGKKG